MTWEDATIDNLDPKNFAKIADISKTPIDKLEKLWSWCYDRHRLAVVHYGPGWIQIMEIDMDIINEASIQAYINNHNNWMGVAIGEQLDWGRYNEPQHSVIFQPASFGGEFTGVRMKSI